MRVRLPEKHDSLHSIRVLSAVEGRQRNGEIDIWTIPSRGGMASQVTSSYPIESSLSWSPDGTQIAFESFESGNFDIWVIPANGGTATQVTKDPASDWSPTWSPDGSAIAFASTRRGGSDIWVMPIAGGPAVQLTFDPA